MRSNRPDYPVGRLLPDNARLRLGNGETVTILGRLGSRIFRGPGDFGPADPVRSGARAGPQPGGTDRIGGVTMSSLERGRASGPSVLVVRASGPSAGSFPPGRSLPASSVLTLRAGDVLTIVDPQGVLVFRGPGRFGFTRQQYSGFMAGGRRSRIGAVRNTGIVPRGPTIWHVDVTQSGTFCLAGTSNVMLWRPDASAPVTLAITAPGVSPRSLQWPAGQATLAWPSGMPIASGGTYSFGRSGVAAPTQITLRTLASEPADLEDVAAALIANGCQDQLDVLVETAAEAETPGLFDPFPAPPAAAPAAVLVDIDRDATICLAAGTPVALSRADDADLFLQIDSRRGGGAILDWRSGTATRPWPPNLPLADGARYELRRTDGAAPTHAVTFRALPADAADDDPMATANALIARGCLAQLDRLIDAIALDEADPDAP